MRQREKYRVKYKNNKTNFSILYTSEQYMNIYRQDTAMNFINRNVLCSFTDKRLMKNVTMVLRCHITPVIPRLWLPLH